MSEWIKCSDRLPLEPDDTVTFESISVLATDRDGVVKTMEFARGGGHINVPWACWSSYGPLNPGSITHWMSLPEAPK